MKDLAQNTFEEEETGGIRKIADMVTEARRIKEGTEMFSASMTFVNFIGAAVFSVIGFFYVRSRGKGVAGRFIPRRKRAERDFLKIAREQSLEGSENKEKIQSQKRE